MSLLVEAHDLVRTYRTPAGTVRALDGISLRAGTGEIVAVTGPSGAGKSTLLSVLAGLDSPDAGAVALAGTDLRELGAAELLRLRSARVGYVFQDFGLIEELTAAENVELPLRIRGMSPDARADRVASALGEVDLTAHARQLPAELSGGQRQRVAVARALVAEPDIVIADEPTAQLDARSAASVTELLARVATGRGGAVVVATHDEALLARAHRVIHLRAGRSVDAERGAGS